MLVLKSPAKINLFLRILKKRSDGYHELASLFQAINLMDTIHFELADKDHFTCNDPKIPADDANLVLKAVSLFRRKTGLKFGLASILEKNIPHQAGLGGGSGNAATTLYALNQLLGTPASHSDLIRWSAEIGSDVAFFLSEGTAYCTGRGEIVHAVPPLLFQDLWIAKPSFGTSTPEVYSKLDLSKLLPRNPEEALHNFFTGNPEYFNDLEEAAYMASPQLITIKQQLLKSGFDSVMLSGSGSSFFCLGQYDPTQLSDVKLYKACYIRRTSDSWY